MNSKIKFVCIIVLLAVVLSLCVGCNSAIFPDDPSEEIPEIPIGPAAGNITIVGGEEVIDDAIPLLSIYSEGAAYMSFSGDGEGWTAWVEYATSYDEFNIANGSNGTEFTSGVKYVYVRFKDEEGNLSPADEIAFDTVELEFGELFSIKILPDEVTVSVDGTYLFTLHGYDLKSNEVPLNSSKATWTKCCDEGALSPTAGLSTTYTAPSTAGKRNISAHYETLSTGAAVNVIR